MNGKNQERRNAANAAVQTEAAERVVRAHSAGVDPNDDFATVAWRREDAEREAVFRQVAQIWDEAADLNEHPAYADLLGAPTLRERAVAFWRRLTAPRPTFAPSARWAVATVLAVMVFAGAWYLMPSTPGPSASPVYATQVAEVREVPLDDGSIVTLGGRSALDVEFTSTERTVRLASGEAFFSVSHDAARPFVVLAGDTRIRVVGTKFNVNYDGGRVRVSVLEGVVEVMRADGSTERIAGGTAPAPASPVRLAAGQQLVAANDAPLQAPEPLRGSAPGAWREGRLNYQDAPLAEIVADANRYRTGEIRIMSPALANERLTTSFRTSQIDQMLDSLPNTLPLTMRRNPDGTVELRSRGGTGG